MNMQGELFEVTSQYLAKQRYYLDSVLLRSYMAKLRALGT